MFILVRSNDLAGEGIVFNTEHIIRMDATSTDIKITMSDRSTVRITREEYKKLGKNVFKVVKIDEV